MPKRRTPVEAAALVAAYEAAPEPKRGKPEWIIQTGITKLLTAAGFTVYSTSQGYRPAPGGTRMTPGIPDLYVVDLRNVIGAFWVEVKTDTGRLNAAQARFAAVHATTARVPPAFCWRSVDDARQFLLDIGRAHA